MKKLILSAFLLVFAVGRANAAPFMYVDDANGRLGTVDVVTGAVSVIGTMSVVMTDIAFDPFGNLFGVDFSTLYSINKNTAAVTPIGSLGISDANALVFGTNGTLYTAGFNSTNLYTVNKVTGAASVLGNMGFSSAGDLAFNSGNLYLASTTNQLINVNLANLPGSTAVGNFGVPNMFGLATGSNGVLYGVAGTNVYTVNLATGAASNPVPFAAGLSAANGESFFAEAGASEVPEPATLMLVGGGLVLAIRKRRQSAAR